MKMRILLPLVLSTVIIFVHAAVPVSLGSRQLPVAILPDQWSFLGCYVDSVSPRTLGASSFVNTSRMRVEDCIGFCSSKGFAYAGLEFGQECYCDNSFALAATLVDNSNCNQACVGAAPGEATEDCGSGGHLSVYYSGVPPVFPTLKAPPAPWHSSGCVRDSTTARVLPTQVNAPNMTMESCLAACLQNGFILAGLEFGAECWCALTVPLNTVFLSNDSNGIIPGNPPVKPAPAGTFCDMPCAGDPTEICGGSGLLDLFSFPPQAKSFDNFLYSGCFETTLGFISPDQPAPLPLTLTVTVTPNTLTPQTCSAACITQQQGATFSGIVGGQCLCGFSISSGARLVPDSFCSQGCPGNHTLACGGGNVAGTAITTIYQRENIVGTLAALATLAVPSQSLVSLIQTVTVANAATVGPQIVTGMNAYFNIIFQANAAINTATQSASFPLTGDFAVQAIAALSSSCTSIINVFNALVNPSVVAALKPAFGSQMVTQISNVNVEGFLITDQFGSRYAPSQSTAAFALGNNLFAIGNATQGLY